MKDFPKAFQRYAVDRRGEFSYLSAASMVDHALHFSIEPSLVDPIATPRPNLIYWNLNLTRERPDESLAKKLSEIKSKNDSIVILKRHQKQPKDIEACYDGAL